MNLDHFGAAESPITTPGLLGRLARRFRAADIAARESAAPRADDRPYAGPDRRTLRERRRTPRGGPDRRRGDRAI